MSVRLVPLAADQFEAWAGRSRAGFAEQQVASGALPAAEATAYAERSFAELFPQGWGTPGQHVWTVHEGAAAAGSGAGVGHLWIRVTEQSDGLDAYLFDIALAEEARGRGLGRATMRAAEAAARELGAARIRLNVFGHNTVARTLYASLGYEVAATMMVRRLDTSPPMTHDGGPQVSLRPMDPAQFDSYRARAEAGYASQIADSGMLPRLEARAKAVEDFARLLPRGLETPDEFFWVGHDGDREVGRVWLHLAAGSEGPEAFGYDFWVREDLRRRGYGRAIMVAAEAICRDRGVVSIGLNVFGPNSGARSLCERMGFEVGAQLLKKRL